MQEEWKLSIHSDREELCGYCVPCRQMSLPDFYFFSWFSGDSGSNIGGHFSLLTLVSFNWSSLGRTSVAYKRYFSYWKSGRWHWNAFDRTQDKPYFVHQLLLDYVILFCTYFICTNSSWTVQPCNHNWTNEPTGKSCMWSRTNQSKGKTCSSHGVGNFSF